MTLQVWYGDVNRAVPAWHNVSFWTPGLTEIQESAKAYEQPSSLDHVFWAERQGVASPVLPKAGMEVLYLDYNAAQPLLSEYIFHGRINHRHAVPVIEDKHYDVKCDDIGEDLNLVIPDLVFYADDFSTDTSRATETIERAVAEFGLMGSWDATNSVPGSGFITYEAGTRTPYHMRSIAYILHDISHDTGPDGDVPARRWFLSGEWSDPFNPGTGGANAVRRVLHYYSGQLAPVDHVPLTDRPDGHAYYLFDGFDDLTGQDPGPGNLDGQTAETGQEWAALVGDWEEDGSGHAVLLKHIGEDILVANAFVSDGEVEARFVSRGLGQAMAFRVSSHPAEAYKWQGFKLVDNSTNYLLRRYQAGSYTTLATIAVGPNNGVDVKAVFNGSTIQIYIEGTLVATVTDAFNVTATLYGIAANSDTSAEWDNVGVWARAAMIYGLTEDEDRTAMINIVALQGPEGDPAPVGWTNATGAQEANDGDLTKTAATDAWDAGAVSDVTFVEDGGYVVASLEETQKVWDGFDRPDNTATVGLAPSGQTWELLGTNVVAGILDREAYFAAGAGPLYMVADSKVATCIAEITFPDVVVGQRLAFRVVDANNLWYVEQQAASYKVYKRVSGSDTLMATHSVTPAAGDVIKVSGEGNVIKLYRNGAGPHATITDAHNQTATKHGWGTASSLAARGNDFQVWQTYADMAFGLGSASAITHYNQIGFGWKLTASGRTAQPVELGVLKSSSRVYSAGERLGVHVKQVFSPGQQVYYEVRYTVDDQDVYVSAAHPAPSEASPMYAQGAIYHRGATLSNVEMCRYAYSIHTDDESIGDWGPKPHNQPIKRDDLVTYIDRSRHARAIFERHARPRLVINGYTLQKYTAGHVVPLNSDKLGYQNRLTVIAQTQRKLLPAGRARYDLKLNDADLEWGDDELIGFMFRHDLEDRRKPRPPSNLASSQGERDGRITVSHVFTWDESRDGARWIYITPKPVGGQAWAPLRFPAAARRAVANGFPPEVRFEARARFEDWNRNVSDQCPAIQFTTAQLVGLPAPTVASYSTGVDSSGRWFRLVINPVPGADRYSYQYKESPQGPQREIPGSPTVSTTITLYGQPFTSTRWLIASAIDQYGEPGSSVEQAINGGPTAQVGVPNASFEKTASGQPSTEPEDWEDQSTGGGLANRTAGISSSGFHSLALYTPGGGGDMARRQCAQFLEPYTEGEYKKLEVRARLAAGDTGTRELIVQVAFWEWDESDPNPENHQYVFVDAHTVTFNVTGTAFQRYPINLQQEGLYTTIRPWNANLTECTIYVDDVVWVRIPDGPEDYGEMSLPLAALSQEVLDRIPLAYTGWVEVEDEFVLAGNTLLLSIEVLGAAVGDSVVVNPKVDVGDPWSWDCWVEEADLVFFRVRNNSPDNETLPGRKWRATVWHYAPVFVVEGSDSVVEGADTLIESF